MTFNDVEKPYIRLGLGVGLGLAALLPAASAVEWDDLGDLTIRRAPYDPSSVKKVVAFWEGRVGSPPTGSSSNANWPAHTSPANA